MLFASVTESTVAAVLAEIERARVYANGIELRLDFLDELDSLDKIVSQIDQPLIFTFRKKEQGGHRFISEEERLEKIEQFLAFGPAYCDLEADTDPYFIERAAKKYPNVKLIGSYHNFEETPKDLDAILHAMKNPHFHIYKIALKCNSTSDMLRLMTFTHACKIPLAAMGMGEYGKPSRILAPIMGSIFSYASLKDEESRYSLKDLHEIFHYSRLDSKTRIFGLLGDPVEQSPGHIYHNEAFREKNENAVYIKMKTSPGDLPSIFIFPFSGLSVTIPLKEVILPYLDQIEPKAKEIGAVNTLVFKKGKAFGSNTDAPGALNSIENHFKVKNKRIAILGAGGTARAIAYEALKRGAHVRIYNRTAPKAKELGDALGCSAHALDQLSSHPYDLLINTIPPIPGGKPPISPRDLLPSATIMDVVYYPKETPLLRMAREWGCPCIYGEEMFREQADLQQDVWMGRKEESPR